jgi:Holliday junction resolvase-like predicted endonuclease
VERLGLPTRRGLKPHTARRLGFPLPDTTGEIDLLIADPTHDRLWVVEVKDKQEAFSPVEIAANVTDFHQLGGHVTKLLGKAAAVQAHRPEVAELLGVDPTRSWTVHPLLLTRRVEPAAFVTDPKVAFVILTDLADVLQSPQLPPSGPVLPSYSQTLA